jgi:hypothetical protein
VTLTNDKAIAEARTAAEKYWNAQKTSDGELSAIPAEPPSPVIPGTAALAFRKHRCENIP